jgi:hypothetical protein
MTNDELHGVTLTDVELPTRDTTPQTLASASAPPALRQSQTLTVVEGGGLFTAVDATLNVAGGSVGWQLELVRSQTNLSAGSILSALQIDGVVNISGGQIHELTAVGNSTLNLTGGKFTGNLFARPGTTINVSAGELYYAIADGSVITVTGGAITGRLTVGAGSRLEVSGGTHDSIQLEQGGYASIRGGSISFLGSATATAVEIFDGTIHDGGFAAKADIFGGTLGDGFRAGVVAVVNLHGGSIGAQFQVENGGTFNVVGGAVGRNLRAIGRSTINISAGTVGAALTANALSKVNIAGGSVGPDMTAAAGSTVTFTGGAIGDRLRVTGANMTMSGGSLGAGAQVTSTSTTALARLKITGGSVGNNFRVQGYFSQPTPTSTPLVGLSTVDILGGTFGDRFTAGVSSLVNISGGLFGESFVAEKGATVNFLGSDFAIDGVPITGLVRDLPFTLTQRDVTLSGLLADGSPFSFVLASSALAPERFDRDATVKLTLIVPEPNALFLAILAAAGARRSTKAALRRAHVN